MRVYLSVAMGDELLKKTGPASGRIAVNELFGAAEVVPGTSAFSWQWAPDITLTTEARVLTAAHGNRWVMTPAAFIDWAMPQVEREEKSRVLRARWNKEVPAGRRRLAGT